MRMCSSFASSYIIDSITTISKSCGCEAIAKLDLVPNGFANRVSTRSSEMLPKDLMRAPHASAAEVHTDSLELVAQSEWKFVTIRMVSFHI